VRRADGVEDAGKYFLGLPHSDAAEETFDDPFQAMLVLVGDADDYCITEGLT
jgi:hypothetical protein